MKRDRCAKLEVISSLHKFPDGRCPAAMAAMLPEFAIPRRRLVSAWIRTRPDPPESAALRQEKPRTSVVRHLLRARCVAASLHRDQCIPVPNCVA
ncbi:MAG: hypothetical protein M3Q42_14400 [Pseudomonadota bacterium]|nr:hypothetical protein [Pseudomonadota bacterium]